VPASLKKLALEQLNRPNSQLRCSNKDDSLRCSYLFFGSPGKVGCVVQHFPEIRVSQLNPHHSCAILLKSRFELRRSSTCI